jgi:capsule synthesis protein PGA_cap
MRTGALSILVIFFLAFSSCQEQPVIVTTHVPKKKPKLVKIIPVKRDTIRDTICIAAVGDIMLGSSYPDKSKLPPDSAKDSFKPALKYLAGSDIIFGNLEGTLLDSGMPSTRKKKLEKAYLFRMPTCYGKVFKQAGFNLLSVANNHITDFGEKGCISTTKTLDSCGIHYAGLESCPVSIFEKNGLKYGFCAFAPNAHTVSLLQTEHVGHIIRKLKKQCDIVIVSFHGGAEGAAYEHVPHTMESFMGAKRGDVEAFAHIVINSGADVVLGNGPHVSRAMEYYKGRLIAYSLGNFCTYKSVSVAGVCGMAPLLKIYLNRKGEFLRANIISFRQTHETGLETDTLNRAAKRIRILTKTDFPESGLVISNRGEVVPKSDD